MLSLTRKADYAIVALAELAANSATRTSAREIADRTHVPLPVLTNILHQLLHHGLVVSTMGVRGGYSIARAAEQITLAEVIDAIEGPFRLTLCCSEDHTEAARSCDLESNCRVKGPVRFVHRSLRQFLRQITLADLAFGRMPVTLTLHGESPAPVDGGDASKEVIVANGT